MATGQRSERSVRVLKVLGRVDLESQPLLILHRDLSWCPRAFLDMLSLYL